MFIGFLLTKSFAQVLAFEKKNAETEGEVLIALCAAQGDLEPFRVSISPESPPSLMPGFVISCSQSTYNNQ